MQKVIAPLLLLIFTFALPPASAQTAASGYFEAGTRAFKQQNYRQALEQFRRAEDGGMQDARLDYNLGSVYYRLGEYASSRTYFEKLVDHAQLDALAYYNLALIDHKLGRDRAAIDLFESCIELSEDPKIRALAQKQIDTLSARLVKTWFAYVAVNYGYDSNITQLPSSSGSDESDNFSQTLALAGWEPYSNGPHSLHTSILYLSRDYVDEDDFDDDSLTLDLEYYYRFDGWELQSGLEVGQSTLGNDDYLATSALLLKAIRRLPEAGEIHLGFRHENISDRESQFDFLDGSLTLFRAEYRTESGPWKFRYAYDQETNDRRNTPDESFSPTRNRVGIRIFHRLSDRTELGALVDYRHSDYRQVPSQEREDDRYRVRFEAEHDLDSVWSLQAETVYIENQSTDAASEFHKYEATIAISAVF